MSLKMAKEFDESKYKEHIDGRTWYARSFLLNLVVILVFFKHIISRKMKLSSLLGYEFLLCILLELRVFWKQSLYLYQIGVSDVYNLSSLDGYVGLY